MKNRIAISGVIKLVFLCCLLSSCGKYDRLEDGGFTNVTFTRPESERFSITSTMTNGVFIYAFSNGFATNLKLNDETQSANITLPNGTYSFYAFGYSYALETVGTAIRCALSTNVGLGGGSTTVTLDFRQSNCQNPGFTPNSNFMDANTAGSTLANSGPIFPTFEVVYCGSGAGTQLSTIAANKDCSTSVGTGISQTWAGVSRFQFVIPIFSAGNGNSAIIGQAYRSPCSAGSANPSGGTAAMNVRFPVGSPGNSAFPLIVESFSEPSCTSPPIAKHNFMKGLIAGPIPDPAPVATALANTFVGTHKIRLFLRQP